MPLLIGEEQLGYLEATEKGGFHFGDYFMGQVRLIFYGILHVCCVKYILICLLILLRQRGDCECVDDALKGEVGCSGFRDRTEKSFHDLVHLALLPHRCSRSLKITHTRHHVCT